MIAQIEKSQSYQAGSWKQYYKTDIETSDRTEHLKYCLVLTLVWDYLSTSNCNLTREVFRSLAHYILCLNVRFSRSMEFCSDESQIDFDLTPITLTHSLQCANLFWTCEQQEILLHNSVNNFLNLNHGRLILWTPLWKKDSRLIFILTLQVSISGLSLLLYEIILLYIMQ